MAALLAITPLAEAAAGAAAQAGDKPIVAPSGAGFRLLDTIRDVPGPAGVTWRYRFVMPDLAQRVPVTTGEATGMLTEEDMAELDSLGLDIPLDGPAPDAEALSEAELVDPEDLDLPNFTPGDFALDEGAFDTPMAVPADPDILLQDPVHEDIAWLCETWVLPRVLADASPPPAQIIISVADRPTEFGEIALDTVQLFEAFSISPDRQHCVWEPW